MASSYAISALTAISSFNTGDLLVMVDVTDFAQAPTGTTKKSTIAQFTTFIHTNAVFTGTTTVAQLTMSTAASQIIPGATSWAVRNAANSANNLILTDAGLATFRNTVTISAGGFTSTGTTTHTGSYRFGTDSTFDIGASGAFRPRDVYIGRNLLVDGTLGVTGSTTLAALHTTGNTGVDGFLTVGGTFGVTGQSTLNDTQFAGSANGVVFGSGVLGSSLIPGTTATYNLGTTTLRWQDAWLSRNLTAGGTITAASLVGPLTGNASTATTAATVTTAAQPAITSVGTLTSLTVSGLSTLNKIKGGGAAIGFAVQAGAGTGATCAFATGSTDTFGEIRLTTGSAPTAGADWVYVPYAVAYSGTAPFPVIAPSTNSASLADLYVSSYTVNGFTVAGRTAVAGNPCFFTYHVGQ